MREVMSLAMYFGLQSLELNISMPKMEVKRRDDFPIGWKSFAEGWVRLFQKKKKNQLSSACIIQLMGESKEWDSLPEKRDEYWWSSWCWKNPEEFDTDLKPGHLSN